MGWGFYICRLKNRIQQKVRFRYMEHSEMILKETFLMIFLFSKKKYGDIKNLVLHFNSSAIKRSKFVLFNTTRFYTFFFQLLKLPLIYSSLKIAQIRYTDD